MEEVTFHRSFLKLYEQAPEKIRSRFESRLKIFYLDPFDVQLNNHPLVGKWKGFRSVNITGDWRAIYLPLGEHHAKFYAIGTHSKLYG